MVVVPVEEDAEPAKKSSSDPADIDSDSHSDEDFDLELHRSARRVVSANTNAHGPADGPADVKESTGGFRTRRESLRLGKALVSEMKGLNSANHKDAVENGNVDASFLRVSHNDIVLLNVDAALKREDSSHPSSNSSSDSSDNLSTAYGKHGFLQRNRRRAFSAMDSSSSSSTSEGSRRKANSETDAELDAWFRDTFDVNTGALISQFQTRAVNNDGGAIDQA